MMRRVLSPDYAELLECCYAVDLDNARWLARVVEAAHPVLDRGLGVTLSLIESTPEQRCFVQHASRGAEAVAHAEKLRDIVSALDARSFSAMYDAPRPVLTSSSRALQLSASGAEAYAEMLQAWGSRDCMGMIAQPWPGATLALIAPAAHPLALARQESAKLHRILIHLEAAMRLRFRSSAAIGVLDPSGQLKHADDGLVASCADQLAGRVAEIERCRCGTARCDPDHTLATWSALVDGRWSLAEQQDADGRRYYLVYANTPRTMAQRALTEVERAVAHYAGQGHAGKEIAFAVGLSQARVSEALAAAASKLGVRSREELVGLAAAQRRRPTTTVDPRLSAAEAEIFASVRAGMTNREIAQARGTSPHTVAKQVSTLLRRLGLSGRRALATITLSDSMAPPKK